MTPQILEKKLKWINQDYKNILTVFKKTKPVKI